MGCLLLSLFFIAFPVAEWMVMTKVAGQIGFGDTLILLILSAIFGTYLAKHQGAVVLSRIQKCLTEGRSPTIEMVDGLLVFVGGLLFVLPGFISDGVGFVLVFPLTRWVVRWAVLLAFRVSPSPLQPSGRRSAAPDQPATPRVDHGGAVDAEILG